MIADEFPGVTDCGWVKDSEKNSCAGPERGWMMRVHSRL